MRELLLTIAALIGVALLAAILGVAGGLGALTILRANGIEPGFLGGVMLGGASFIVAYIVVVLAAIGVYEAIDAAIDRRRYQVDEETMREYIDAIRKSIQAAP